MLEKMTAYWTYDEEADAYYFAPMQRREPPYRRQIIAEVIIDVADDGTLAGIELIDTEGVKPPPH